MKYEYIRLYFDFGDLAELNSLGSVGWKVVCIYLDTHTNTQPYVALLERPLPETGTYE